MNATLEKFGYPASAIREFDHWVVLIRPVQMTLGSVIIGAKSDVTSFGALPPDQMRSSQVSSGVSSRSLPRASVPRSSIISA